MAQLNEMKFRFVMEQADKKEDVKSDHDAYNSDNEEVNPFSNLYDVVEILEKEHY